MDDPDSQGAPSSRGRAQVVPASRARPRAYRLDRGDVSFERLMAILGTLGVVLAVLTMPIAVAAFCVVSGFLLGAGAAVLWTRAHP